MLSMRLRSATDYESFQWSRLCRNPHDPGLILSYSFKIKGLESLDRLNQALRAVLSYSFPTLLQRFYSQGEKVFVEQIPCPHTVLFEEKRREDFQHVALLDPTIQLYSFRYAYCAEGGILLRFDFSHLGFDGTCFIPFCDALAQAWDTEDHDNLWVLENVRHDPSYHLMPQETEHYWHERLKGQKLFQHLPFCFSSPAKQGRAISIKKTVPEKLSSHLIKILSNEGFTLFQALSGVLAGLIRLHDTDSDTIVISHTVDTRGKTDPFGCYTTLNPLFIAITPEDTFRTLVHQVKNLRAKNKPHQAIAPQNLIALADPKANYGGRPFNLLLNPSPGLLPHKGISLSRVEVEWREKPNTAGPNDLAVIYALHEDVLSLSWDSSTQFMTREALTSFADHFLGLLEFVVTYPDQPLSTYTLTRPLSPISHGPLVPLRQYPGILERVLDNASRTPKKIATCDSNTSIPYGTLKNYVSYLADLFVKDFPTAEGRLGVFLERSWALPMIYLSAMGAGRAFVPMDLHMPDARLSYMVDAAHVDMIIVDQNSRERAGSLFPTCRLVDISGLTPTDTEFTPPVLPEEKTAYILFTSGSTGDPKGVAISRENLKNFLYTMEHQPGFSPHDHLAALTPISFDISILELLLPLMCGGTVEVLSDAVRSDGLLLAQAISKSPITVLQATPSTWRLLKHAYWKTERPMTLLCGGEALEEDVGTYLLEQGGRVYNMYGPTEATIWATTFHMREPKQVFLGEPVYNSHLYVCDSFGRSVAPGMQGELVLAGACVGQGYLNTPKAESFIQLADGTPAYKTGDVVHYFGDGKIAYIGRYDTQCKVNGYRIDLAEMTERLRAYRPDITFLPVVRRHPEPHVCCFVWSSEGTSCETQEILTFCKTVFPYYMVPKGIHHLITIPLTPNGKVDIKTLSEAPFQELPLFSGFPGQKSERESIIEFQDVFHKELHDILREHIGVYVGDPNYSLGMLGLNSISYSVLATVVSQKYGITFRSHEFFAFNTIHQIAERIRGMGTKATQSQQLTADTLPPTTQDRRLAIVGYSSVMPGGHEPEAFWRSLSLGTNSICPAPLNRGLHGRHGGFLPDIRGFDAAFFSVSPLEANAMDPRQRLMLQATWRCLEDAAYAPAALAGSRIGVYIAATGLDYALLQGQSGHEITPYSLPGHSLSILANRISSFFDWCGPSFTMDTACSGSLSALVKACRDLQNHVCDSALVGGINLILHDQINQGLAAGNFMSPDFRCATFDHRANGYVRGEGYGCFYIKRLDDALAAHDLIHGVIEGLAENHGGRAASLTAPKPQAQRQLLLNAYTPELAEEVTYIETHGTGTQLGDPIEVDALKQAWQNLVGSQVRDAIWLGAVKTNIGHLEPAAGMASLTKVLKAFEHKILPSNIHFERLNPAIVLEGSPFQPLIEMVPWRTGKRRVAGISSFGFGGTNAHIVLAEPPERLVLKRGVCPEAHMIAISARSPGAFLGNVRALATWVRERLPYFTPRDMVDLAFTLSCRRTHFSYRQAWIVSDPESLFQALSSCSESVRNALDYHNMPALKGEKCLETLRKQYLEGYTIDWAHLYEGTGAQSIRLPTYRFEEKPFWFE